MKLKTSGAQKWQRSTFSFTLVYRHVFGKIKRGLIVFQKIHIFKISEHFNY